MYWTRISSSSSSLLTERKKEKKRHTEKVYNRSNEENVTYNRVDDAYTNAIVNIDFAKFISQ